MFAELPITFPLSFVEVLVARGFLRKKRVSMLILDHVRCLVAHQARFHDQQPGELVVIQIVDACQDCMLAGISIVAIRRFLFVWGLNAASKRPEVVWRANHIE